MARLLYPIVNQKNIFIMYQSNLVGTTLFTTEHPHIAKHTSSKSVILSIAIALLGVISIYFSLEHGQKSSTVSMMLLTMGTILILLSLYRLFWKSSEMVYTPTRSVVHEGSCYLDIDDLDSLQRIMAMKNFDQSPQMTFKSSGNGRLDYMVSKDGQFAAVQLFRFVPYTYEPISDIYYYTDADAKAFQNYLEIKKH